MKKTNSGSDSASVRPVLSHKTSAQKLRALPKIADKVFGVPLMNPQYPSLIQGAYKTKLGREMEEHALIYKGDIANLPDDAVVLMRINSACYTGDILHDSSCDCNWQLEQAFRLIEESDGPGLVIYHFNHEGKGHGYLEKLKAFDGEMYPVNGDIRDFRHAIAILLDLGIRRVRVMTNNPEKQEILRDYGIELVEAVPIAQFNPLLANFYEYKRRVFGHSLPDLKEGA